MKILRPTNLFIILLAAVIVMVAAPVWADKGDDIDTDSNATASGDFSNTVRDTSRAIGLGAGDVDIAQCYRSYSVIIWQDSRSNPLCIAQQLMAEGNYEAAAVLRCQPWGIHKAFGGKQACIKALSVPPKESLVIEEAVFDDEHEEIEREYHEEQQQLYEDLMAKIRNIESGQKSRTVVQREEFLSESKKAALRELVK